MDFLKRLFGGGGSGSTGDRNAFYVYVQPHRCDEMVEVRINLMNDLSRHDDGGFFVRKLARGHRCPFPSEIVLYFDEQRRLVNQEIDKGQFVSTKEYEQWIAEREEATS